MKKTTSIPLLFAVLLVLLSGCIGSSATDGIMDFNYERDAQDVLKIFYDDWDWLFPGEDYSPEYIIETMSPGTELYRAQYRGKLKIKVLRVDGRVAGFTCFFKKNFYEGQIQFVAVSQDFRRKGYAKKLTRAAALSLFDEYNCTRVFLFTREDNVRARSLYEGLGFQDILHDNGFVTYSIKRDALKH